MNRKINKKKLLFLEHKRKVRYDIQNKYYLQTGKKLNRHELNLFETFHNIIDINKIIKSLESFRRPGLVFTEKQKNILKNNII